MASFRIQDQWIPGHSIGISAKDIGNRTAVNLGDSKNL